MLFFIFEKIFDLKLIIDIGNTNTKIALFDDKKITALETINHCTFKEVDNFVGNNKIEKSIISSVKKQNDEIDKIAYFFNSIILNTKLKVPILNLYKSKKTLGNDRLASIVGASYLYSKKNILVLDLGTCLTSDFITSKKEYIGGRISPGIDLRLKALNTFTDNLPLIKKEKTYQFIGNTTKSSIISGVQSGIIAEIKLIIDEFKNKYPDIIFILTGGDCFFFEKELKNTIFAEPNLVLIGLNEILDYNE